MEQVYNYINYNVIPIIIILIICCLILAFISLILLIKIGIINKRLNLFFGTNKKKHSIEVMLIEYIQKVNDVYDKSLVLEESINAINKELIFCIKKIGVVRYNPFEMQGGDLSFVLALLDSNNNGFVLNVLHNREQSYCYAKSVNGLEGSHPLSDEEKEAISKAINYNGKIE